MITYQTESLCMYVVLMRQEKLHVGIHRGAVASESVGACINQYFRPGEEVYKESFARLQRWVWIFNYFIILTVTSSLFFRLLY